MMTKRRSVGVMSGAMVGLAAALWGTSAAAFDGPAVGHASEKPARFDVRKALRSLPERCLRPLSRRVTAQSKRLGQVVDRLWKPRPEWGDMAVALLKGEDMRPGMGWWGASSGRYGWSWLRERFDANKDDRIEQAELPADFQRFFDRLDRDLNGRLVTEDFDWSPKSEYFKQGALAGQLFYLLDKDSNGRIVKEDLERFFARADREGAGYLTPEDLRAALAEPQPKKPEPRRPPEPTPPLAMLHMLFSGQMGVFQTGPQLDEPAPAFTLPSHDGETSATLPDPQRGKPVVLVFGSFT